MRHRNSERTGLGERVVEVGTEASEKEALQLLIPWKGQQDSEPLFLYFFLIQNVIFKNPMWSTLWIEISFWSRKINSHGTESMQHENA